MPKYQVCVHYHASTTVEVEADTPEEALDKAEVDPSLCWRCSDEIYLGDPHKWEVYNENCSEKLYEV